MSNSNTTIGGPSVQATEPKLEAALARAKAGVPVFPLAGKHPIEKPGEPNIDGVIIPHGQSGFHQATTDLGKIERWAAAYPGCNWGTPTGQHTDAITGQPHAHPFDVLDVDPRHGGHVTLARLLGGDEAAAAIEAIADPEQAIRALLALIEQQGDAWRTPIVITGSWGLHIYWDYDPGLRLRSAALTAKDGTQLGLDLKTTGGYVVGPDSCHPDTGRIYVEAEGRELGAVRPQAMPPLTVAFVKAHQRERTKTRPGEKIPLGIQEASIMALAGAMRRQRAEYEAIRAGIDPMGKQQCEPPVADVDLDRMAASACNYDPESVTVTAAKTDLGNAERLVDLTAGKSFYNSSDHHWYHYDGIRWLQDKRGHINILAGRTALVIELAAINMPDDTAEEIAAKQAMEKHARYSQSLRGLTAMVKVAQDPLTVTPDELDTDLWALNCLNGTIDLRTGQLRPHDPADRITMLAPVVYDPEAQLDEWDKYLAQSTEGKPGLADFTQRAMGYTLTGDTREDKLFFVHGPTKTGKSTLIKACNAVMGDYGLIADFSTFLKKPSHNASGASGDLARLAGKRFVSSIEVEDGKALAVGIVKGMTGGDKLVARALYQSEIEFEASHKLWLVANDAPKVNQEDEALWERIFELPVTNTVPPEKRDLTLKARLADPTYAGPAVLAWMVKGCLDWQAEGLNAPEVVKQATADYKASMDPIGPFLEDFCELDPKEKILVGDLWTAYITHCKAYREKPLRKAAFKARLEANGVTEKRTAKGTFYGGISLKSSDGLND